MDKKKILVVDDEKDFIEIINSRLEPCGYNVIAAYNGLEGLKKAQEEKPDLILLDIKMPGIDGFETLRRLKNNPDTRDMPVIFLTAKTESESIFKGQNLGAVENIIKPVDLNELLRVIKKNIY